MKVRKEIIRPSTTVYIDPKTGLPAKLVATSKTIKHWHDQGNAMLADGLSVPVPLEHQPSAFPMTAADLAAANLRNNSGQIENYEIGEVIENGKTVKDVLFGVFDIKDKDVHAKLGSTINFTSPWISSFTDGKGKKWENVIGHVALTTRPRLTKQEPFAPSMAAALSLVNQLSDKPITAGNIGAGVSLSLACSMRDDGGKLKPRFPGAFSLATGVRLSEDDLKELADDGEKPAKDEDEDEPVEEESDSPLDAVPPVEKANDVSMHEVIGHMLKALGFNPPDGMDETTFLRDVYETLMARMQELGAEANKPEEPEMQEITDEDEGATNPIVQENPSMYASLDEIKKIADPKEKRLATELFKMRQESNRHKKRAESAALSILAGANANRERRIKRLAEKLPAARRDKLLAMAAQPSAALSLADDGKVVDPMAAMLEILDGASTDLTAQLSAGAREVSHPADGATMTDERRKAVVDEVLRNTGHAGRQAG